MLTLINTILAGNTTGGFSDPKLSNIGALPVVVTTAADSGLGAERAALGIAPGGAMITFASYLAAQTITPTSGEILLNTTRAIDASGSAGGAKVSENNTGRIFRMGVSGDVTLMGLKLTNGAALLKSHMIYRQVTPFKALELLEGATLQGSRIPVETICRATWYGLSGNVSCLVAMKEI